MFSLERRSSILFPHFMKISRLDGGQTFVSSERWMSLAFIYFDVISKRKAERHWNRVNYLKQTKKKVTGHWDKENPCTIHLLTIVSLRLIIGLVSRWTNYFLGSYPHRQNINHHYHYPYPYRCYYYHYHYYVSINDKQSRHNAKICLLTFQMLLKWSWVGHHWNTMVECIVEWCIAITVRKLHINSRLFFH